MTDSFFTARNQVDDQATNWEAGFCESVLEASARRLTKLEGPLGAAKRLQRISDICSGAYVLPIEHWRQPAVKAEVPTQTDDKPRRWQRVWLLIVQNPGVVFWTGFFLGIYWGGLWS